MIFFSKFQNWFSKLKIINFFSNRYRLLIFIAIFILIWIGIIKLASFLIISDVNGNWDQIFKENSEKEKLFCISEFNKTRNELSDISEKLSSNLDIRRQLSKGDTKKIFDEIIKLKLPPAYQVEIYDKFLSLVSFQGRQLEPGYLLLQKALQGKKFSVLKDNGFYTYLIIFSPIYDDESKQEVRGVSLTARLTDIKYHADDKFESVSTLTSELTKSLKTNVEIIAANPITDIIRIDSSVTKEFQTIALNSIDGKEIGKIILPLYDKTAHIASVNLYSTRIISILILLLTVVLLILIVYSLNLIKSSFVKIILFTLAIIIFRYVWFFFDFPSKVFESDIFSSSYFASSFGFGIFRSLGELFVTSIFCFVFAIFSAKICSGKIKYSISNNIKTRIARDLFLCILFTAVFFTLFYIYGSFIQSIIIDSNIKFLDKSNIIPNLELFIIQFVLLIITVTYLILGAMLILLIIQRARNLVKSSKISNIFVIIPFVVFLAINQLIGLFFHATEINFYQRSLIIILLFIFCFYVNRMLLIKSEYSLLSLKNFSIILLICIIIAPLILLEKNKSQETKFAELIGNELSEQEEGKIVFLISNELSKLSTNSNIESSFNDKTKLSKLAFYLWKESILNTKNYSSEVILLDTNKKIISDFNINSVYLNTDSVVSFINRKFFSTKLNFNVPDSEMDTILADSEFESGEMEDGFGYEKDSSIPVTFDNINILKNKEQNYFAGISVLENQELKNTEYAKKLGYLILVISSESKNQMSDAALQIFRSSRSDNISDKIISNLIITEFINGEVKYTTDQEVSRNLVRSLEPFHDFMIANNVTKYWRYDLVNNERYKTFYILAKPADTFQESMRKYEKIYAVSLKRDDFAITMFYYLKFILFTIFVYLVFYAIISIPLIYKIKKINFNFRVKLFTSFVVVSIIPIILLAVYTRTYITDKNNTNFENQIVSDLSLVNESLKDEKIQANKNKSIDTLKKLSKEILDKNFSNTEKNFNFFVKTKLIATTNDELYKSDLLDPRVDAEAYYNLMYLKKDFFIKPLNIGGFSFFVGYKPFKDKANTISGIISSISVFKQKEINEELTETLTIIFGSYFVVSIILLILVGIITSRISKPLLELKIATEKLSKGQSNIEIKLKRNDEFGSLVDSFNKMTKDLERSKIELKRAEREAAWRDIARRVAHEIKNPLTPMKLSIQHLFNIYKEKRTENFEEVLGKTKQLITSEIDKLNHIATEFSNFAKLPRKIYERVNVNIIFDDVISLYSLDPNVEFVRNLSKDIKDVYGDKQELNRAFQNIIKNAVQSLNDNGKIEVKSYSSDGYVFIEVKDNGCGIEPDILDKLCEPNFSTKSQGMGLGLAITKKTLDDMHATISFESILDKGTTVKLKFIAYDNIS
jgi:nitrogen fixation/metabolism regulation signal transduction histidine kinase